MNNFWAFLGGITVLAVVFLAFETPADEINFTDLETECRYDRTTAYEISLNSGNVLSFSGHYPVNSTDADTSYRYSKSGDTIRLNVVAKNETQAPSSYVDSCLASVVYEGQTSGFPEGSYTVVLQHNGEEVERQVIGIK